MSQSSSADAAAPGAWPARRGGRSALALRNWRVACRLIVLVALPTVLGLVLAGLQVTEATRSAAAYAQVGRLAVLGQQVTGLAQAMEDERADTAAFIADGRPAAGLAALHRQYVITDGWAVTVRRLVLQPGQGYPAQPRAGAAAVLGSIADLPGLRRRAAQSQDPALAVTNGYSAATAGLFGVNDGIADLSGNSALITSVRALGSLSRMKDQAAQQQAILAAALTAGRFAPGALTALTTAQARQASDLASFRGSATPEESWALTDTLAGPLAGQARAVEQRATAAGDGALAVGPQASQQWQAGMSYTIGWMRHAEQQLAAWITGYAQDLQRSAMRSAIITSGAALAVLILVLLATMIMARSIVRPLRRLEAAALDIAGARLPAEVRALGAAGNSGHPLPVMPIDVLSTDEIGHVARAFDRVHREAVRLAGEEARQHSSVNAIFAGFFRRSHFLLERLLRLIDNLELGEDDSERLASLFQMDHLATRMRRSSDSALVLTGHETPRRWTEPVTLVDVLRAAVSEIEQYDRVILDIQPGVSVSGSAAADTVHLLAELLENATTFSPETTQVTVSGHTARGGALIRITDAGPAMPEKQLRQLNRLLARPPLADMAVAGHMGLFAVAHLATRHGINVVLELPPGGGTTAEVHLPTALISLDAKPGGGPGQAGKFLRFEPGRGPGAVPAGTGPRPVAPQFAARPEFALGPEIAMPDAVPLPLGAPLPAAAPATSFAVPVPTPEPVPVPVPVPEPEPADAGLSGALPSFESVESDHLHDRGRGPLPGEPQAGQPMPRSGQPMPQAAQPVPQASEPGLAGQPASASWVFTAEGWHLAVAAGAPAAGALTAAGLPQRTPQGKVVPPAVDPEREQAMAAESAQVAPGRLASFQRGSRRARMDCDAKPAQGD